jgi:hypothetical protein
MRATFITLAMDDGADPDVLETRLTHTRKSRNAFDGYNRGLQSERTCAEVSKASDRAGPPKLGDRAADRGQKRLRFAAIRRSAGGFLGTMRCTVERGRLDPMTAAVKAVLEQAMQLSPEERAEVANALDGMSADAPALSPDDLAAAWRPELDRRREELERGEVQTVDAREAIAGIRARLRSGK